MASVDDFRSMGVAVYEKTEDVPFLRDESWGSFKGAYGNVFRATRRSAQPSRPSLGQEDVYAIKEIQAVSAKDQLSVAREIRLLQLFRHENILQLESAFIVDVPGHRMMNIIRLVTRPWAPVSLQHFIEDLARSSGVSTICSWFRPRAIHPWPSIVRQCLSGLAYLHGQQPRAIRHKDIKPHNILLSFETENARRFVRPIIIDFGISKEHIDGATTANTGTYQYKAPEQINKQMPTLASDVFSLGCCFALVEGVLCPWPGLLDVHNAALETDTCQFACNTNLVNEVLQDRTESNSSENRRFGAFCIPFRNLVQQMLAIEPTDRPTAAHALQITERLDSELARHLEIPTVIGLGIPFSRDRGFVDRGDILNQLYQQCSEPPCRVALVGQGGVGKSQLAIEFAYRIAEHEADRSIFWFYADTHAHVKEGFRKIAEAVKLPNWNQAEADIPKLVYDWLSEERSGRWIIILDCADDREVLYKPSDSRERKPFISYLPQNQNGSILITTRDKGLALSLTTNIIEVKPMLPDEAILLLERRLGRVSDIDTARQLVETLGLLPLAISQAASYIKRRSSGMSTGEYLAKFQSLQEELQLSQYKDRGLRSLTEVARSMWQTSFDQVQAERPSAMELLALLSFFNPDGIDRSLINSAMAKRASQVMCFNALDTSWPESNISLNKANIDVDSDVAILEHFALVRTNNDGSLTVHWLVQTAVKEWLEGDGLKDKFKQQFVEWIAAAFPNGDYDNWATCRQLFTHVEAASDQGPAGNSIEEWAALMHNGGWYALSQGWYEKANKLVGKALRTRHKEFGVQGEGSLHSASLFSLVIKARGLWKEAEKLEVEVLAVRKGRHGTSHLDTLMSMGNLASTYRNQGRLDEAEKLEVEVVATCKAKLTADHPNVLTSMNNLALTYIAQHRWDEAETLLAQVIEIRKAQLGEGHPDTLASTADLARTYWSQERPDEAAMLMKHCVRVQKESLGTEHPHYQSNNALLTHWESQKGGKETTAVLAGI